jgi:transcriptional regulator with XRE-family HTH domain
MDRLGLTQQELADPIGLNRSQISKIISGKSSLTKSTALAMQAVHGIAVAWLMDGEEPVVVIPATEMTQKPLDPALARMGAVPSTEHLLPKIKLRYYPNGVPASPFNLADDSYEIMELARTEGLHEECIVVRVRGNSLTDAGILSGDLLIVDTRLRSPSDGDLVIAAIGEESTVKFWSVEGKNGERRFYLEPASIECERIEVTGERDLRVNGTVTEVRRARPHRTHGGADRIRDGMEVRENE